MSTTSKSPKAVAIWAYELGKASLPAYNHVKSPKKYTQHQLFALLVLKEFFNLDYRGIVELVADFTDIREILELEFVPHYTTLQKASKRLLDSKKVKKLLAKTVRAAVNVNILSDTSYLSAIDSTGMENGHVSKYFVQRRRSKEHTYKEGVYYKRFPKLALVCDCLSHIILEFFASQGPSTDVVHFKYLLTKAHRAHPIAAITADAGYDSEANHEYSREVLGIHSIINPRIGRPTTKLPKGRYRREMKVNFPKGSYGQRWQVETVMSMLKRNLRENLFSHTYWGRVREMSLKVITHNLMII